MLPSGVCRGQPARSHKDPAPRARGGARRPEVPGFETRAMPALPVPPNAAINQARDGVKAKRIYSVPRENVHSLGQGGNAAPEEL